MIDPKLHPADCGITYEEIASKLDPSRLLGEQFYLFPDYPAWWLHAATEPNYRQFVETEKELKPKHKKLLEEVRKLRRALNPECYSVEGKQRQWPHKKNKQLLRVEMRLHQVRRERQKNQKQYYQSIDDGSIEKVLSELRRSIKEAKI
jgi:hypothetical protein